MRSPQEMDAQWYNRGAALAALVLLSILAGCVQPDAPIDEYRRNSTAAVYEDQYGSRLWVALGEPEKIMVADGSWSVALPVMVSAVDGPSRSPRATWIDSHSTIVRQDSKCLGRDDQGECVTSSVLFINRGELNSWGVRYDWSFYDSDGTLMQDPPRTLEVDGDIYKYDDSWFPYEIEKYKGGSLDKVWKRVYLEGQREGDYGIDPPITVKPIEETLEFEVYPGEDQDYLDRGYTIQEALQYMRSQRPVIDDDLERGCITISSILISHILFPDPSGLELPIFSASDEKPIDHFDLRVTFDGESSIYWAVTRYEDDEGNVRKEVNRRNETTRRPGLPSCPSDELASYLRISAGDAWDLFKGLDLSSESFRSFKIRYLPSEDIFIYEFSAIRDHVKDRSNESSDVSFLGDYVQIDADTGLFRSLRIMPEDHKRYGYPF